MDDDSQKKARAMSFAGGIIYGIAWWLYIDGAVSVEDDDAKKVGGYSWLPAVGCTIAFIMINGMRWQDLSDDDDDSGAVSKARAFLIAAIVISMGCIAAALVIMMHLQDKDETWAGVSVFIQNMLIFLATFVMRFGTITSDDE